MEAEHNLSECSEEPDCKGRIQIQQKLVYYN